jgi:hypothetical protein
MNDALLATSGPPVAVSSAGSTATRRFRSGSSLISTKPEPSGTRIRRARPRSRSPAATAEDWEVPGRIVRFDVETGASFASVNEGYDIVSAIKGTLVVATGADIPGVGGPPEVFLVDPLTGLRTHRFLMTPAVGEPRIHSCPDATNQVCVEELGTGGTAGLTRAPAFAPGSDSRVVFAGRRSAAEDFYGLYIADLAELVGGGNAAITRVDHAGDIAGFGDVAWSQDGEWIVYGGVDGLYVISAPGAATTPVGPLKLPISGVSVASVSWAADLLLPAP